MSYTADTWPIAAALLQFPGITRDGRSVQDAAADEWAGALAEVARVGFSAVDLTDSWLRIGDLSSARLDEFRAVAGRLELDVPAVSVTRRSVTDRAHGDENLAYVHRTIDAAAALGIGLLSIGFHQPLTPAQRDHLWFWNAPGGGDDVDDPEAWNSGIARIREIGRH